MLEVPLTCMFLSQYKQLSVCLHLPPGLRAAALLILMCPLVTQRSLCAMMAGGPFRIGTDSFAFSFKKAKISPFQILVAEADIP